MVRGKRKANQRYLQVEKLVKMQMKLIRLKTEEYGKNMSNGKRDFFMREARIHSEEKDKMRKITMKKKGLMVKHKKLLVYVKYQ